MHRNTTPTQDAGRIIEPLTRRETEVLTLIGQGMSNPAIARQLVRSKHTVHRHVANILAKLALPSRAAVAVFAAKHHLV